MFAAIVMWFGETCEHQLAPVRSRAFRIADVRKAAILFNPASGRRRERRLEVVKAAETVLKKAGVETSLKATGSHEEAVQESARAVAAGCDTVIACGGDGTVHAVIQSLAGTPAQLAVIPLGT